MFIASSIIDASLCARPYEILSSGSLKILKILKKLDLLRANKTCMPFRNKWKLTHVRVN